MKSIQRIIALGLLAGTLPAVAGTVAYWRFEEGPAGANVPHGGLGDGVFFPGTADSSGNGNELSVWAEGWAGYGYRDSVAANGTVPTLALSNNFSVKNTGGYPAMFTESNTALQSWSPAAWTIEAAFKLENNGYKTIVGRDSRGSVTTGNLDLAALYLQLYPNNGLAIKYCDVSGYWHEAMSVVNLVQGFDFGPNPDGVGVPWQAAAAVCDGQTLSLYYKVLEGNGATWSYQLVAQTDLTLSGSPNTALTPGAGDGGDWDAGNFTVGRGLYAGGHGDRAFGFIDEVRISDEALSPAQFLFVPEPAAGVLALLSLVGCLRRRR